MHYRPLDKSSDQIRLVHLAPRRNSAAGGLSALLSRLFTWPSNRPHPAALDTQSALHCSFTTTALHQQQPNCPSFEAISYAWGNQTPTRAITLQGRPFLITENLHAALLQLRLPDRERILWIDALCINQSDNLERADQVARMREIYTKAAAVIVCLGDGWEGCDLALDAIERLAAGDGKLHLDPAKEPHVSCSFSSSSSSSKQLDFDAPELRRSLVRFFDLPWWHRLWTVQEYVLAPTVVFQCGERTLPGYVVQDSAENFFHHKENCCAAYASTLSQRSYDDPGGKKTQEERRPAEAWQLQQMQLTAG